MYTLISISVVLTKYIDAKFVLEKLKGYNIRYNTDWIGYTKRCDGFENFNIIVKRIQILL